MIERYIPRIKRIIDKIHLASENPFEKKILWLEIQEELIKLITSVEYKIRKSKSQIQILKRELSTRDLRLSKIESQTKKDSIEYFKYKIESYSSLLILTRTFGDAIAHTFINRFDIKPQSFKETTGYLTNKKGSRLERKCLRGAFQKGGIAILNDLTNALRYFDLTLIKDKDIWFPFEMKSGKHKTDRDKRQEAGYEKLMDYLHLDKPADILKKDMLSTRVSMKREPKNHIQTLNKLINKALKDGFAHQQVEEGLFYLVRYFADIKTEKTNSVLNSLNLKKPIPFFINNILINDWGLYPLCLILGISEYFIDLLLGHLEIVVFFDYAVLEEKFKRDGYNLELLNEEEYFFSIEGKLNEQEFKIGIGTYLVNRVFYEFLSPNFLYTVAIDTLNALPTTKGLPQGWRTE